MGQLGAARHQRAEDVIAVVLHPPDQTMLELALFYGRTLEGGRGGGRGRGGGERKGEGRRGRRRERGSSAICIETKGTYM